MNSALVALRSRYPYLLAPLLALGGSCMIVFLPAQLQSYFVAAAVMVMVSLLSLVKPTIFLYFVIFGSALAGFQRTLSDMDVGQTSMTVSGLRWIYVAAFLAALIVIHAKRLRLPRVLLPLAAFSCLLVLRWAAGEREPGGLKEVLFYGLPLLVFLYVGALGRRQLRGIAGVTLQAMLLSIGGLVVTYAILLISGDVHFTVLGPDGVLRPRPTSLFLLVALAAALASWRYAAGAKARSLAGIMAVVAALLVLFTFSRTSSVVAILFLTSHRVNPLKVRQLVVGGMIGLVAFLTLVFTVPMIKERFFFHPDVSLFGSLSSLNTMGRSQRWELVWESAVNYPVFGQGPGSARAVLITKLSEIDRVEGDHPHNEYLQTFHDLGIVGVVLLIVAWGALVACHWRRWRQGVRRDDPGLAKYNMMALYGIMAVLLTSITDNTMHYAFVVVPVSVLSALALRAEICGDVGATALSLRGVIAPHGGMGMTGRRA